MKKTGAWLARYALEQLPIAYTFGIPGMQNTELYDELYLSEKITPILVTHEESASFAADGIARSSAMLGVALVVPGAGVSNAMSGICEAYLDGIPLLVIAGAPRLDTGKHYQLHQIDQRELVKGAVKKSFHITAHDQIVPAVFDAYDTAVSGCPGPVFIEIPVEIQMMEGDVATLPIYQTRPSATPPDAQAIQAAVDLIKGSRHPGIFAGWGCKDAAVELTRLAELLQAPVSVTMQGLGVFPGTHPLHAGMGFGASAVPAARNAFKDCDCLIAVATRFAEVATGSYGVTVPANLIHIDIDPTVFDKNYPARIKIAGDAAITLSALIDTLESQNAARPENAALAEQIRGDKEAYAESWAKTRCRGVNPALFLKHLSALMDPDDYVLSDVGNHAFLMAEHFTVRRAGHFIAPCDFNCMGYAVPAALGIKLTHPDKQVAAVVGDGCFLMTGMETLTAAANRAGIIYCVFRDGELAQISQTQKLPYRHKTCTVLPAYNLSGIAEATGAEYIEVRRNKHIVDALQEARAIASKGRPVILDVRVDYARKTAYTRGVVKTNLARFPLSTRYRLISRAVRRRIPFLADKG
ncbi:MAG: thiamine pyrophosphate-binding protein [Syntrophaceae bacterium]